jgi:hypothetical protein
MIEGYRYKNFTMFYERRPLSLNNMIYPLRVFSIVIDTYS